MALTLNYIWQIWWGSGFGEKVGSKEGGFERSILFGSLGDGEINQVEKEVIGSREETMNSDLNLIKSEYKREWSSDPSYNIGDPWNHGAKLKKLDIKGHTSYDLVYRKCPEQANL